MGKAKIKRKHFWEYLIINIFVFVGIFFLSFIVLNVSIFDTFTQAFRDFTLTDLYYSKVVNQDKIYNGPLVLVNLENRNRIELALLLEKLEEGTPKVIGIDAIFPERKDSSDSLLRQVIVANKNIIIPYIASFSNQLPETRSDPYFETNSNSFVNLVGERNEFSTIRYYYPKFNKLSAFTTEIIKAYDSTLARQLEKRNEKKTEIKYYGNLQNFVYHNYDEVMDPSFPTSVLKNKIILLGYFGLSAIKDKSTLDEDRFFTPLNPRLSGRSLPDMYGVIIHANILRMALDKDYIFVFPSWLNFSLAFFLSWLLMPLFVNWFVHKALWFSLFSMFFQLFVSILFLYSTILLYAYANVKIESSVLLVSVVLIGDFISFYNHIIKFLKYKLKWNFHSKLFEVAH